MNPFSRLTQPPIGWARAPQSVAGQRQIELLRLVRMGGIFGVGSEEENAAGDRSAREGAALADPFAEAVVVEEALAETGACIALPPIEFIGERCDGLDKGLRPRRGEARQTSQRGDDGKRAGRLRTRHQFLRPVAKESFSLRARCFEEGAEGDHDPAQRLRRGVRRRIVIATEQRSLRRRMRAGHGFRCSISMKAKSNGLALTTLCSTPARRA
jgi:hypothetical protein